MEEKGGLNNSGFTVKSDEISKLFGGSTAPPPERAPAVAPPVSEAVPATDGRKKRGRPRKYARDGSVGALSPMPISASIPLAGEYSGWKQNSSQSVEFSKKKHKLEFANQGGAMPCPVGGSFIPHVITVNPGEDINMKIISFSQQGSRAICILAANGAISNVTLRQSNSSGGTLTYEGRFEILSLTGSFMPSDNGLTKSRSGGMSVSLAGPDGRVLGGGLAGMLVASSPVQVVIGSFPSRNQHEEQKPNKKPKYEQTITFGNPDPEEKYETSYNFPKPNITNSVSFHGDNSAYVNSMQRSKIANVENNVLEGSREKSHELTC